MPTIEFFGLIFEWHDDKYGMVYQGRNIEFEEACSVFFDDYEFTYQDDRYNYDESRFITIGMSHNFRILTVVWTERNDITRIITAHEPSKSQLMRYNNARR